RPGGAQGQIERRACAGEILFQLSSSLGEQRARRAATVVLHPVLALERCRSVPGGREVDPGDTGVRGGEDELADVAGDAGESHGHWELDESDPEECSGAAAWSTSDASVATVSGSGLVAAVAVGGATITATSEGKSAGAAITVTTPSSGGTPDPTLLPVATTLQAPLTAAYDALNVPAIAAGGSYRDPTTGVKMYKVT